MSSEYSIVGQALNAAEAIFWDFDGVLKDSVDVKTDAYVGLFRPFGEGLSQKVKAHHERHGGVSRFEKIPLYMGWAGETPTAEAVAAYCQRFSEMVKQAVIDSPWVPGVLAYLEAHSERQYFVLVTATPQAEIDEILARLGVARFFRAVIGAPTPKAAAIRNLLARRGIAAERAIVVGDSETDHAAALANGVPFVLRTTPLNGAIQATHTGLTFERLD